MSKYQWSEVFMSIEGEAKYSGHPTVYIRFTLCNFQCKGFNNPTGEDTTTTKTLGFVPSEYKDIYSIPLITKGCDSIYSWDTKFSHMWNAGDSEKLGEEVLKVLPFNSFINPNSKTRTILSITGGEPTLRFKQFVPLLSDPAFKECKHVLIETNCSVPLRDKDITAFALWAIENDVFITWSNSPKLSSSGEKWDDAIKPEVAMAQLRLKGFGVKHDQYFKFVCDPTVECFEEVGRAMSEYYAAGISRDTPVYIMPTACTEEQQQQISARVAKLCIEYGYIYCHRIQNSVFGNGVGT